MYNTWNALRSVCVLWALCFAYISLKPQYITDYLRTLVSPVQRSLFVWSISLGVVPTALVHMNFHPCSPISRSQFVFILLWTTIWFTSCFLALCIFAPFGVKLSHHWRNQRHFNIVLWCNLLERRFLIIKRKTFDWTYDVVRKFSTDVWPMLCTSMHLYKWIHDVVYTNSQFLFRFHCFNRELLLYIYTLYYILNYMNFN